MKDHMKDQMKDQIPKSGEMGCDGSHEGSQRT